MMEYSFDPIWSRLNVNSAFFFLHINQIGVSSATWAPSPLMQESGSFLTTQKEMKKFRLSTSTLLHKPSLSHLLVYFPISFL